MTSLVVGIMSIFIPLIGVVLGILGITYANKGLKEIDITGEEGINYAKAGKACSAIGLCLQAVLIVIILIGVVLFSSFDNLFP